MTGYVMRVKVPSARGRFLYRYLTQFDCLFVGTEDDARERERELRRLVKNRNPRATVVTWRLHDTDRVIEELQHEELRDHPEVLHAIADFRR